MENFNVLNAAAALKLAIILPKRYKISTSLDLQDYMISVVSQKKSYLIFFHLYVKLKKQYDDNQLNIIFRFHLSGKNRSKKKTVSL